MRLTKIQKHLKKLGVDYTYSENYGCGEITFEHNGKNHHIAEITGNKGNTIVGVVMGKRSYPTSQKNIISNIDYILKE